MISFTNDVRIIQNYSSLYLNDKLTHQRQNIKGGLP